MGLGLGITLIVIGAILGFTDIVDNALNTSLDTVGWIMMAAGLLSLIVGLIMNKQNNTRRHYVEERRDVDVAERRDTRY